MPGATDRCSGRHVVAMGRAPPGVPSLATVQSSPRKGAADCRAMRGKHRADDTHVKPWSGGGGADAAIALREAMAHEREPTLGSRTLLLSRHMRGTVGRAETRRMADRCRQTQASDASLNLDKIG